MIRIEFLALLVKPLTSKKMSSICRHGSPIGGGYKYFGKVSTDLASDTLKRGSCGYYDLLDSDDGRAVTDWLEHNSRAKGP